MKEPKCKICGGKHYKTFCSQAPKTPIKRTPIKLKPSKPRRKKSDRDKLKKKLELAVKTYIKQRDNYTCQHCHKKVEGSNCHASHILSVGAHSNMQFEPRNMKVLCFHCHRQFWHGDPALSSHWYIQTFPENWAYLIEQSNTALKIPTCELQDRIDYYTELVDNSTI